jgi:hypothetical protein
VPVDVRCGDDWVPGWLTSWHRGLAGKWRASVIYTRVLPLRDARISFLSVSSDQAMEMPLTWEQVRPAADVRPRTILSEGGATLLASDE